ncbi:ATP-grasp domain-containing protein [Rhizobium laguerreae]|uniref:ATP-grasp domain-containing protein n=1 Tax=Rhizobium laguerreae TaxID=1076926 RepID=UPI001C904EB6|nr:ATP-grasp domain-containing protein [Rhizobium laguerreae]MBY3158011.1 ATP-grasp domain-containing protein [Rhizobium laguerreae]MBY3447044.1 ATP-grasp domain-containing protein [Rhizobium laguerreae]
MKGGGLILLNARRRLPMARLLAKCAPAFGITDITCCDTDYSDALRFTCDSFFIQRPLANSDNVEEFSTKLRSLGIKFIVAWLDSDIRLLSENRELLSQYGITAFVPPFEYTDIFTDKQKTAEWAASKSIDIPRTIDLHRPTFPLVAKLRRGQGGFHVRTLGSIAELQAARGLNQEEYIFQELIDGEEYTVDVVLNGSRGIHCIIPRRRIKVRGSEVVVAETADDSSIVQWVHRLMDGVAFCGIINIQLFATRRGLILIEINPRFGGGSELSIAAGADLPSYLLSILTEGYIKTEPPKLRNGLVMTRYLEAAFFQKEDPLTPVGVSF